jgi:hypothetical protein
MEIFAGFTLPRLRNINAEKRAPLWQRLADFKIYSKQYGKPMFSPCGPYQCRQFAGNDGLDFYLDDSATMPLLRYTLGKSYGYDECEPMTALVMRLAHGRGFLAGWTMGENMASEVSRYIWDDEADAMNEAERMTQRAAEDDAQFQADERAKIEAEDDDSDPAGDYLEYLTAKAEREPHNAAFLGRVAGNVRKVEGLT